MTPTIIVYEYHSHTGSIEEMERAINTPGHMRYAAVMVPTGPGTHWTATGSTAAEATGKLQAMWEKERKSIEPRKAPPRKPKGSEDVGDVV